MSDDVEQRSAADLETQAEQLELLALRDELIGLSAEIGELRASLDTAAQRADASLEAAQRAERDAADAAEGTRRFGEYLAAITDDRDVIVPDAAEHLATRAELVARIDELEAVLQRRAVRWPLALTRKLRGS